MRSSGFQENVCGFTVIISRAPLALEIGMAHFEEDKLSQKLLFLYDNSKSGINVKYRQICTFFSLQL